MQNMAAAITRLQATTDALGALGARLSIGEGDTVAPEILAALDRYDCVWLPSFFFGREILAAALPKVIAAALPGGYVVMAHYEPPPDALPRSTMRLRTIRDGGSVLDADGAAELLRSAGCQDVHSLTRTWPIPVGYVVGQKA
jgi:hypothetical protein